MSDTETVELSAEARSWARVVLDQYRAVEALHHVEPRWQVNDGPLFETAEEALEHEDGPTEMVSLCAECSRIERAAGGEAHAVASRWPCATAEAMGAEE